MNKHTLFMHYWHICKAWMTCLIWGLVFKLFYDSCMPVLSGKNNPSQNSFSIRQCACPPSSFGQYRPYCMSGVCAPNNTPLIQPLNPWIKGLLQHLKRTIYAYLLIQLSRLLIQTQTQVLPSLGEIWLTLFDSLSNTRYIQQVIRKFQERHFLFS